MEKKKEPQKWIGFEGHSALGFCLEIEKTGQEKTGGCIRILKKNEATRVGLLQIFLLFFVPNFFYVVKTPEGFPLFISTYRWVATQNNS